MKRRIGFVSNSSSSSFIIASDKKPDDIYINISVPLTSLYSPERTISSEEELKDQICDNWGYETFEELVENKGKYVEEELEDKLTAIKEGKILYTVDCSNEEGGIESALYYTSSEEIGVTNGTIIQKDNE